MSRVTVSVCMITYNHSSFIAQAIEGVLMQQTSFEVELIIGDDCSTDNTREICKNFQSAYPDRIKLLLPEENLGMMLNLKATLEACSGKYIAFCEGDDYWTDPQKLRIQVDFMEQNPNYSGCFTAAEMIGEGRSNEPLTRTKETFDLADFIQRNEAFTLTSMFRQTVEISPWVFDMPYGDWPLWTCVAKAGKIKYIDQNTACYRVHSNGVYTRSSFLTREKNCLTIRKEMYRQIKGYDQLHRKHLAKQYYKVSKYIQSPNCIKKKQELIKDLLHTLGIQTLASKYFWKILLFFFKPSPTNLK